jgi:hypothetical protein
MKSIKYTIIGILLISLGFHSCNKDEFLKEEPKDKIYADNLLQNYDGFVNMMNGIYAWVRAEKGRTYSPGEDPATGGIPFTRCSIWNLGVDNGFMNNGVGEEIFLNWPTNINTGMAVFKSTFEWLYLIVNSCNMVIERAEKSDVDWKGGNAANNEKRKNYIVAQARVIRAWAYRHLTYTWGDVPLSLKEINGETYRNDWERTPVAEVRAQMALDLQFGVDNLHMRDDNPSVVNGAFASHYLADTYLALGEYAKAEAAARKLCEGTEYQLMNQRFGVNSGKPGVAFMDVFLNPFFKDGNKEVIFILLNVEPEKVSYGSEPASYLRNMWQTYYSKDDVIKNVNLDVFHTYNGGKGAGRYSITAPAFSWYEASDDRFSEYAVKKTLVMPNAAGVLTTLRTTSTAHTLTEGKYDLDNYLWPSTRKWEWVNPIPTQASSSDQFNSIIYLRLSDTYLLLAEALHKQGKNADAAIWINKVRERSHASAITAANVTIDFILDERSRELITEEHRRHALIRNGKLVERVQKYNDFAGPTIANAPALFPIPQSVIDANTGRKMLQNPGYY